MDFIRPKTVEDLIVIFLKDGEKKTTEVLSQIREIRKNTTKQAFYAALRKLKKEEVVLVYKGSAALHTTWVRRMQETIDQLAYAYSMGSNAFSVLGLADRESLSFVFYNSKSLDIFWGHSQNILIYNTSASEPIYAYDPHYWFLIAREESETKLFEEMARSKKQFLMTVGGNSLVDNSIRHYFKSDYLQYNIKKIFVKNNYYITVIGDYITEVTLDSVITKKIEDIYAASSSIDETVINSLKSLLELKSRSKIKITRDKKKAEKLKKKLGKDFYILKN